MNKLTEYDDLFHFRFSRNALIIYNEILDQIIHSFFSFK